MFEAFGWVIPSKKELSSNLLIQTEGSLLYTIDGLFLLAEQMFPPGKN